MEKGKELVTPVKLKFCPDLVGHKQEQGVFIGTGMINRVIISPCLKEECVAYENGVCKKYNTAVEDKEDIKEE